MKLRRKTIVTVLAILAIAATIPYAAVDTLETGRSQKSNPGPDD